jgi:hypothetical protein
MFWIKHTMHTIIFYPVCEDTHETTGSIKELLPLGVILRVRPFPRKAIALSTPLLFKIETEAQAQGMGALLKYLIGLRFNISNDSSLAKNDYWHPPSESEQAEAPFAEEGKRVRVTVSKYERKIENREACIRANGTTCIVCGFDFPSIYGAIGKGTNGKGYIHVHHLTKLASLEGKAHRFNPVKDMCPVCPNCHEMLHQADPPYTPEQLQSIIADVRERASGLPARIFRA